MVNITIEHGLHLMPSSHHQLPLPKPSPTISPPANLLISTIKHLSSSLRLSAALSAFSLLRLSLPLPSSPLLHHPISSLLSSATSLPSPPLGPALHALSLSLALLPSNPLAVSRLAAFYASSGSLHRARALVLESNSLLPLPWNILLSAHLSNRLSKDAIFIFLIMLHRGLTPDKFTSCSVLKACAHIRDIRLGRSLHSALAFHHHLCVSNALVSMYAKCGAVDDARKVFDQMPQRDLLTWNSMLLAYSSQGRWEELLGFVERMRFDGFDLNSVSYNTIICGLLSSCNHGEALGLISQTRRRTTHFPSLDSVTLVLGLKACADTRRLKQGKEIHGSTVRAERDGVENVCNALITLYSRCRCFAYARIVFERSSARSVVTWNSMIAAAFSATNDIHGASSFLREMIESGTRPSQTTIVTMLALCADCSILWLGEQLHCYAVRHGFEHHLPIGNSMVDMYCKSGRVSAARKVFELMPDHDEISYTALIAGYASRREGVVVRKLVDQMIARGIEPDLVMMEVIRSVWGRPRSRGRDGLCDWNHSSVEGLVQHG